LRHAIEAEWPRRGTRLGAEHESAVADRRGAQKQITTSRKLPIRRNVILIICAVRNSVMVNARVSELDCGGVCPHSILEANMNKLMSSSMFGLAPVAPTETLSRHHDEEQPAADNDDFSRPIIERRPIDETIARIREELAARGPEGTKHAHWCSVLLRATWRRVCQMDSAEKGWRF
jgi:hypothetical protein